ncbi:uncharacterized protein EI90DRAFT_2954209 [Cantharellus anzutake]|uniref:uncharacterized protein n=1 Tax=Cantharellus anzutake TaxID=1750568 RepID=UPI0019030240|nr:uncharacterized protein EI90DRAFT_2954209 [Cantharellus anzutake]KAF8311322.1 hypothetical protein EI90DRAFT_2954209 [Cantharellus anzutake]
MYGDGREVQRELTETPEAHLHLESLLNEINAFIESPGKNSIKLPPMSKGDRKVVHFLANSCYHLATKSFGTEKTGRHVVLTRTPQTQTGRPRTRLLDRVLVAYQRGTFHQEGFIRASDTVRRKAKRKGSDVHPAEGGPEASKNSRKHVVLRPKEGDIVGRKAEPIGESNVGFQLLQRMGWSQGERIGATGGSTIPLPVVVKVSKLGLGTISYARPVSP